MSLEKSSVYLNRKEHRVYAILTKSLGSYDMLLRISKPNSENYWALNDLSYLQLKYSEKIATKAFNDERSLDDIAKAFSEEYDGEIVPIYRIDSSLQPFCKSIKFDIKHKNNLEHALKYLYL